MPKFGICKPRASVAALAGMYFLALSEGAKRRGVSVPGFRDRYLPFGFYPVTEFAPLLVFAAERFYPDRSLRQGLRAIGKMGPTVFLASTLGKVTLGSTEGALAAIAAIAKTYSINSRPAQCTVRDVNDKSCVVCMTQVEYFLDSHHVGVFEGTLEYAYVEGRMRIASRDAKSADLLLEWS
ncbi:MAG TPA: DUF2378 family protein [Polyangiaceae bacterium]|jgi:uncharacterized protein (TIGR02265 family)|nr:DUF2378 family protein [Polyangiaceae bacterium]